MELLLLAKNIPLAKFFQVKNLCRKMKSFKMDTAVKGRKRSYSEIAWF